MSDSIWIHNDILRAGGLVVGDYGATSGYPSG